ncbi:MAG: ribonuclease E/G [Nitrospinae bacterium]|nr:ribonuclease E/G [Nitrospinota bacterium]
MIRKMLINTEDAEESRVAIVTDGTLEEFDIETSNKEQIKGNIYKGLVVKVEPGLQAAFVDYGGNRAGFLPLGEVHPTSYADPELGKRGGRVRIHDVLKRNQAILVQVVKDEIGTKGAALTTYISLPGRYLVLMPGVDATRVSRKIEDEAQRRRLKEIVAQLAPPAGTGVIIRTAGLDRSKQELQRDMAYLMKLWETILAQAKDLPAPSLVYQERDLVIRSIRDYFTSDIAEILVDDRDVFKRALEFLQAIMPRYVKRIKLYREKRPIFSKYQLEEQIEAIFEDKIPLKSGGSIVIERTEAMVAIDVNSGRSTQERGMEETAFKTNLEAAEEIARQLRLRDLGGLIVIDFIDMRDRKHIQEVERCLKNALKRDKARVEVSRISKFGLLELSRQRLKPALQDETYLPCVYCNGQGLVRSPESLGLSVLRNIQATAVKGNIAEAKALVPLEVANYLLNQKRERLVSLEREYRLRILVEGNASLAGSHYNLEFDRKEVPLVEEGLSSVDLDTAVEVKETEDIEEALAEEVVEVDAVDEGTAGVEAGERDEEMAASAGEIASPAVVATFTEAAASLSRTTAEPATKVTGGDAGQKSPPPPRTVRPHGRFWWLRRLVSSTGSGTEQGSVSRTPASRAGSAGAEIPAASEPAASPPAAVPQPSALAALSGEEASWGPMLAPLTPPRQMPFPKVEGEAEGDQPSSQPYPNRS